jgi:glycosyltransferase involved in cell wall biosynthesis
MLKLSIIIPAYNRADTLSQALEYLTVQEVNTDFDIEIVVVDDGSTDHTSQVIKDFSKRMKTLTSDYIPRDEYSNRSRTKNRGAFISNGDVLVFMDTGILVPRNFCLKIYERYKHENLKDTNLALIHYMYGLWVDPSFDDMSIIDGITPDNINNYQDRMHRNSAWIDYREGLFDLVHDDLDQLDAPWSVAWGLGFTVTKRLFDKTGGFDESFMDWGGEDKDFTFRLFKQGAQYKAERDAFGIHLPHPVTTRIDKTINSLMARKKIHTKNFEMDTELYTIYPGLYFNNVMSKFNKLVISDVIPKEYSNNLLNHINHRYLKSTTHSLILGSDCVSFISNLQTTHVFAHNLSSYKIIKENFSERTVNYLLGFDTPYEDGYFDLVIVTDFIRLLGPVLQKALLEELSRISRYTLIIYTNQFISLLKEIDGGPWSSLDEIKEVAKSVDLKEINKTSIDKHSIVQLATNRVWLGSYKSVGYTT